MTERLNINDVTTKSKEWTSKLQVIDKGRPRDNLQKTSKYQLVILQDEEETQVQGIMFGGDITHYENQFVPFHTYLVSVATVKESNYAYGILINNFTWTIDKGTLVEPIEEVDPPEASLPPPTRLTLTMFDNFEHQPEGSEFDILAVVVNVGFPTCAANGCRIQDLIIMDDQKKPAKLTLWEHFIDHDGIKIVEQLDQFPIIWARKIGKSKSFPGLTTRFGTTIQINPPYPQVAALRTWVRSNEQLLIAYAKKSTTSTGSLQIIPFEDQITSIVDAQQHTSGQIFCIQAEFSLLDENQYFYILVCSDCKQIFTRLHSKRRFYCITCRRSTNLIPRCQFEITVTDNSGSATALIMDEPAETMLHLTSEEVYNIRCTKKQMLPLVNVTKQLTGKTFTIQVKKSLAKTLDGAPGKLIILSYVEKDNTIGAPSSPTPMDRTGSSKRKIEDPLTKKKVNQDTTSKATSAHYKHVTEVKVPPPKHHNK